MLIFKEESIIILDKNDLRKGVKNKTLSDICIGDFNVSTDIFHKYFAVIYINGDSKILKSKHGFFRVGELNRI